MYYTLDCLVEWERRKKEIEFAARQNLAKQVIVKDKRNTLSFVEDKLVKLGKALEMWGRQLQTRYAAENGQGA